MNIHEYQAKQVLKKYGVPTSHGVVALKADDIDNLLDTITKDLLTKKDIALNSLDDIVQSLCVDIETRLSI